MLAANMALHQQECAAQELWAGGLLDPKKLTPFVDPLHAFEHARSNGFRPDPTTPGRNLPYFSLSMRQVIQKIHRDLPPTEMWGFESSSPGPLFDVKSGEGILVEWKNELPVQHMFSIDHSLCGAEKTLPDVRTVIHLHGGRTPAESDGYPEKWFTRGESQLCHYPNRQDSCLLFYHDHAIGINRLNTYAGLFGLFVIRDEVEESLDLPKGKYEVPIALFDRILTRDGKLRYPVSGNPDSPWVPEVYGNCILVNGGLLPYLDVEPCRYRFRIVNGSNARFYRLTIGDDYPICQIGSDQGLLSSPAELAGLVLAPGERVDVLFDFNGYSGQTIILRSGDFDIMQFRVGSGAGQHSSRFTDTLRKIERTQEKHVTRTRFLTLNEKLTALQNADPLLPPEQRSVSAGMFLNNVPWHMPVTEKPILNSTEIWELANLTEDSHPIHLHLVRFQLLDRRPFDVAHFLSERELVFTGAAIDAPAEEAGWKDTIRADAGMVTRIIIRFEDFTGRYMWHCHVLEHADNEMMRPYEVVVETMT